MTDLVEREEVQIETPVLIVTPAAAAKVRELLDQRSIPDYALRVFVQGGGCSGLQYGMAFAQQPEEFDTVVEAEGVKLIVDPTSLMYVGGATIDFVDSLMGGGFRIDNPNAVASCGCGHSFRTKDQGSAEGGCSTCGS
ncbi:MAG TPA: iron-sulfur cluster insertion protein ErpA [Aggregatilineales bacterium]|nr:iron-sulfur cluster insertion protein ErpA [Aggregatilineales bacterium]